MAIPGKTAQRISREGVPAVVEGSPVAACKTMLVSLSVSSHILLPFTAELSVGQVWQRSRPVNLEHSGSGAAHVTWHRR